jgi:AraC-like DNA-binding protein/mannose-6-phosphate isomerase-like protein (cupin superfamily)
MGFNSFFKYVSYSSRDQAWGIYCIDAGAVEIKPGEPYPYRAESHPAQYTKNWEKGRILNEYQFLYILKGEGLFRTALGETFLHAGSFVVLVPGVWHWYRPKEETGWIEYWVGFDGVYPKMLSECSFLDSTPKISDIGIRDNIVEQFTRIIEGVANERPGFQQIVSSRIPLIYAETRSYAMDSAVEARGKDLFDRISVVFKANIYSTLDMEALAESLNLNYATFREEFKLYTGLSPYQYFLQMKINRAKELLFEGGLSVKEISYKLSFDNPYYFSRLFKKKTGVSPSLWNGIKTAED